MEWIKVSNKLPEKYKFVLFYANFKDLDDMYTDGSRIFVGRRYGDDDYECAWGDGWIPFQSENITHWMTLPEAPRVDE